MAEWLSESPFAHRGLHGAETGYIENSISAFSAAIQNGYGFELDVLLSQDGKAIVVHDENLLRLTGKDVNTIDKTRDNLSDIMLLNSQETIPSLSQVLEFTDDKAPILIEIKGDQQQFTDIANAVWQDIKSYNGKVAIMSFYPEILNWFQDYQPNVLRGLVATPLDDGSLPRGYFNEQKQIEFVTSLDIDFIAYDIRALPNPVTEYCRHHDIPVLTWTVRTDEDHSKAIQNTDNIIFET